MNKLLCRFAFFVAMCALTSAASGACVTQPIAFGATVNGNLTTDDCVDHNSNGFDYYYDYFEFDGTAGQQIVITNNSTTLDPDVLLIFPDNNTIVYNDDSNATTTNARIPPDTGFFTLPATGKYHISVSTAVPKQTGSYTLTLAQNAPPPPPPPPPPTTIKTIEFYNIDLKHYFVTAVAAEGTAIDNGSAGPGWVRTGAAYEVYGTAQAAAFFGAQPKAALVANPVCRFYGTPGKGPNSHFYTVDANECSIVKQDPGWQYEGIAYYIQPPVFGSCPAGTTPIYRLYNGRAQFNDSNHRFVTSKQTFLAMGEQGWTMEGIVMCTSGVTAPVGVTGGSFKDTSGASVDVMPGQLPSYTNAAAPSMRPVNSLPPGLSANPQHGETNVTAGGLGHEFNLTGDSGFSTTAANAVTLTLPFNASQIPPGDLTSPVKIQARVFNPADGSVTDLTGEVTTNGANGTIRMDTRGMPPSLTAMVVHNPNIESATSEEATPAGVMPESIAALKVARAAWPAQSWCVIYNRNNPNLIAAVKAILGLAGDPTAAQIRSVVVDRVAGNAKKAQTTFENHGLNAPNLVIARTCGGNIDRYNIHLVDGGSKFTADDPGEVVSTTGHHFGRLMIGNDRIDDSANTNLGSVLASVAHEMHHAVQNGYEILGSTPKGYKEGAAAVYGKTIDNSNVIKVRSETKMLSTSLMSSSDAYDNEDFVAYVARQYNGASLNFLSGLYARMHASIGAGVYNPAEAVMYDAMDTHFKSAFGGQSLGTIYLDFLKQRALTHNAASQLGRAGETQSGFARNLFAAGAVSDQNVVLASCATGKIAGTWSGIGPFAARAFVIKRTGADPANNGNGPTLQVKITPSGSSVGALWNGWVYRGGTATALAAVNKLANWGKVAPDETEVIVANLDPANELGAFDYEISCAGLAIDSIAPVRGPVGTVVTINGSGFGTASDTRSITFNGLAATTVSFSSDTQATATVPANASTGDVVVTVNGQKSNGVPFEVVAQCSATQNAGGDTPDTRTIELGKTSGTFNFTYDTYSIKDRIIVRYQNNVLLDTGCVGESNSRSLSYSGTATSITVQVMPNCAGDTGTAWQYSVSCP